MKQPNELSDSMLSQLMLAQIHMMDVHVKELKWLYTGDCM
jgi:hypothetical protein